MIFGTFAGIFGTILSILIRAELIKPGAAILGVDDQLYNGYSNCSRFCNDFLYGNAYFNRWFW